MRCELGRPWGLPLRCEVASDACFENFSRILMFDFLSHLRFSAHCSNLKGT